MGNKIPKNVCPFPHAFTFSSSITFWGETRRIWSSILHVFRFSASCMPSPSSGSHRNIVVHSDHSLFHSIHACCVFVLLIEPCFVLVCSPVVTILSHTKVWGLLCLLNEWVVEITQFYEKEWSFFVSSVLLCSGILCHRVSGSLFCCVDSVVCYVCIFLLGLN